jgi:hypothetical protein
VVEAEHEWLFADAFSGIVSLCFRVKISTVFTFASSYI